MKNLVKGKFEDAWQMAFDNAEQAPSENVWTGIEQGLNKAETVTMKRKVVFYQRLAAASILFALLLGGLGTYYVSDLNGQRELNLTQEKSFKTTDENEVGNNDSLITDGAEVNDKVGTVGDSSNNSENVNDGNKPANGTNDFFASVDQTDSKNSELSDAGKVPGNARNEIVDRNYPSRLSLFPEPSFELKGKMKEVTIIRKLPAMPSSFMTPKKETRTMESLWASLGASTGNYSPSADFTSGSSSKALSPSSTATSNAQGAYSTTSSKGSAFSVGMNLGKRLSKRWLLQGGVSYLNQAIGYTSNYAVVDVNNKVLAAVTDYANLNSFSTVIPVSSPYEINSVNEFISVPVQAGYLLVDRKIGLQFNSGLSTDFFMQNTLTDKSGQLASYSSGAGDESPYRTVSWAGLVGTELSYKIASHYRVSIAPGLRYSLNSVLKSDVVSSNPLVWDVGFRFRYIFK